MYAGNLKNESLEPGAQEMVSLLVGDEELEGKRMSLFLSSDPCAVKQQQALAKEREKEKRRKRKAANDKGKEGLSNDATGTQPQHQPKKLKMDPSTPNMCAPGTVPQLVIPAKASKQIKPAPPAPPRPPPPPPQ